jgi:hypothetical protein
MLAMLDRGKMPCKNISHSFSASRHEREEKR